MAQRQPSSKYDAPAFDQIGVSGGDPDFLPNTSLFQPSGGHGNDYSRCQPPTSFPSVATSPTSQRRQSPRDIRSPRASRFSPQRSRGASSSPRGQPPPEDATFGFNPDFAQDTSDRARAPPQQIGILPLSPTSTVNRPSSRVPVPPPPRGSSLTMPVYAGGASLQGSGPSTGIGPPLDEVSASESETESGERGSNGETSGDEEEGGKEEKRQPRSPVSRRSSLPPLGEKFFNDLLYDALNSDPAYAENPEFITAEMYGPPPRVKTHFWRGRLDELKHPINGEFRMQNAEGGTAAPNQRTNEIKMKYDVWTPSDADKGTKMPTLVLTNGVPVNRREWYTVARLLGRFVRVVTVDLFGMGESSQPLDFWEEDPQITSSSDSPPMSPGSILARSVPKKKWLWSWRLHADIFEAMFSSWRKRKGHYFMDDKLFFGANDWGAGALQKFVEMYGEEYLYGASINSAVALNGYWVQHIGALAALAKMPYFRNPTAKLTPSEQFVGQAVAFMGTYTTLLESMFDRTREIHNQYTMRKFQDTYAEMSYGNPSKNPGNTFYKAHAVRVLAEQASVILGNGELLPSHATKNPQGMDFTKWNVPIHMMWGKNDKMMPEGQVYRFAEIFAKLLASRRAAIKKYKASSSPGPSVLPRPKKNYLRFTKLVIADAGHFAVSDQPEVAAESLYEWMRSIVGARNMRDTFLGFSSIARQDEPHVIEAMRDLLDQVAR